MNIHEQEKNKEIVETWLKNREYELINNLPLTDIEPEYNPKGSVSICKNSWRGRVTLKMAIDGLNLCYQKFYRN